MDFILLMIYHILLLFGGLVKSFIKLSLASFTSFKNVMPLVDCRYLTNLLAVRHKI